MSEGKTSGPMPIMALMLVALVGGVLYWKWGAAGWVFHEAWRGLRYGELWLLSWIPMPVQDFVGLSEAWGQVFATKQPISLAQVRDYLGSPGFDPRALDFSRFDLVFWRWFSWIPALALIALGWRNIHNIQRHDGETLLKDQVPLYPHLAEVVEERPDRKPLAYDRSDPATQDFGISIDPYDFSRMEPPLGLEAEAKANPSLMRPIWDGDEDFDVVLCFRAFRAQMGSSYVGIDHLSKVEAKLYDALTDHMTYKESEVKVTLDRLLPALRDKGDASWGRMAPSEIRLVREMRLANITTDGKKDRTDEQIVKEVLAGGRYQRLLKSLVAESIMERHAFVRAGMMSLLDEARKGGVVPALEFRSMLKGADRILWYCMSTVGRKVSFVECGGVYSHWIMETAVERPLLRPDVTAAVRTLAETLPFDHSSLTFVE